MTALTLWTIGGIYKRAPKFNELFGDNGDLLDSLDIEEEGRANLDADLSASLGAFSLEIDMACFYRIADARPALGGVDRLGRSVFGILSLFYFRRYCMHHPYSPR